MRIIAEWHNRRGSAARERRDLARATACYEKAIAADPGWSVPWYNLGLLHKEQHEWPASLRCNQQAVERDSTNEPAWWNLGIAATALGDWIEARRAWTAFGINLPEGTGEIVGDFGSTPIRINPRGNGEVIWTRRIDPARAVVESVPLPESGHRHGDLLLHDGAPNGYRMLNGYEIAVFDELEVLAHSSFGTFEATLTIGCVEDLAALEEACDECGAAAEDWSTIRYICIQCSEGRPHAGHDYGPMFRAGQRRVGIAAPSLDVATQSLLSWTTQRTQCRVDELKELLKPGPAA